MFYSVFVSLTFRNVCISYAYVYFVFWAINYESKDLWIHFALLTGDSIADGGSSNHLCGSQLAVPEGRGETFFCSPSVVGRFVYVRIPGLGKILTLCEVEVYSGGKNMNCLYRCWIKLSSACRQGSCFALLRYYTHLRKGLFKTSSDKETMNYFI